MVGGAVLFLSSAADITACKDQAGQATGLPDLNSVTTGVPETCAPTAFPIGADRLLTDTQNPQTFYGNAGPARWLLSQHKGGLHGPMIIGNDTKDAAGRHDPVARIRGGRDQGRSGHHRPPVGS